MIQISLNGATGHSSMGPAFDGINVDGCADAHSSHCRAYVDAPVRAHWDLEVASVSECMQARICVYVYI